MESKRLISPLLASLAEGYRLDEYGIIRSPGKFEGEPAWVIYVWNAYLDGFADEDKHGNLYITLTSDERKDFRRDYPDIRRKKTLRIATDDFGFVYSR